MVKATFGEATFTKIVVQPTLGSIKILTTELTKVASTFSTTQWGGTYVCFPLILAQDEMRYVAKDEHFHSGPMSNPTLVNSNITYQTTSRKLALLQELQRQIWREFDLQVAVDRAGVKIIAAVIGEQYVEEKKYDYRGYAGETTLYLLAHVRTWSVITNAESIDIKAIFYAPLSDSPNQHTNTYARQLYRSQRDCATLRVDVSNTYKVTHFSQQMYQIGLFEDDFLEE